MAAKICNIYFKPEANNTYTGNICMVITFASYDRDFSGNSTTVTFYILTCTEKLQLTHFLLHFPE